jgi:threonine dehydrogenase-like Zn-dependent dehydrogenase
MKTLVYEGPEKVAVHDDYAVPELRSGQVRIKVTYCGICGSDIGIFIGTHPRAKAPLVLGHEFIGVIDEIKDGTKGFQVGDRVSAYPLLSCGECFACKAGIPHVCQHLGLIGIDCDGGIAEYVNCSEDVIFKIDDSVSDKAAAVIEPLAVVVRSLHQANFQALDSTVVVGAGPIGVLTGILLKHCGASQVIISDVDEARLAMCRELGLDAVNVKETNLVDYVNEKTNNVGVDIVFECSGAAPSAMQCVDLCRIYGTICMTGVHKMPHEVNLRDLNFKEQTMVGTRVYTLREFEQAVELTKNPALAADLEKTVTQVVPIEESDKVFDMIKDPSVNTVKVVVDCRAK